MTLLIIIAVIGLASWLAITGWKQTCTHRSSRVAFVATCFIGMGVSIWLMSITRQPTATLKLHGVPFPLAGSEFMYGKWVSGLVSSYGILALLGDVSVGLCICLLLLRVAQFTSRKRDPGVAA